MRRTVIGLLGVTTISLLAATEVLGQAGAGQGSPWLAWVGCWEGAGASADDAAQPDTYLVCFQPVDAEGVEILTYSDGELVSLETLVADGQSRPLDEGGCVGDRAAEWSSDGSRVFLRSELTCAEGVTRSTRGLMSILPGGANWAEIQAVGAGDDTPLVGLRTFAAADPAELADQGIPNPGEGLELAVQTARAPANRPLTPASLVETVERTGSGVTSALLVERGDRFGLDTETLRALQQIGVPGEVVDVMVAMTYPDRFEISGGGAELEPSVRDDDRVTASRSYSSRRAFAGYSPWGLGYNLYWDPFYSSWNRYGYGSFGYGRFGYDPYGFGYYGYRSPRVIVVGQPTVQSRSTLSRNQGVVRSGGGSGSTPRATTRGSRPSASSGGSAPSSRSSGSSSASPRSSGSSSSGGNSGAVRTARPRN